MSDEVKAAAERVRRRESGESINTIYPDLECGFGPLLDKSTLADAYLAEHPADDNEPITEDWLRSVGFHRDDERPYWWINTGRDCKFDFQLWDGGECWLMDCDNQIELQLPKTRGDVRLLCRALGITLKDQNTSGPAG